MTSGTPGIDLSAFIKAYDVRGLVGSQLTDEVVSALAAGFVDEVDAAARRPAAPTSCRSGSAPPTKATSPPDT